MIIVYIFLTVLIIICSILTITVLYCRYKDKQIHNQIRPTPVLRGKSVRKFYEEINDGKITEEQKKFLEECEGFYEKKRSK